MKKQKFDFNKFIKKLGKTLDKLLDKIVGGGTAKERKRRKLILLLVVLLSIMVAVLVRCAMGRRVNTSYNGLGRPVSQPLCEYNTSLFSLKDGRMTYSGPKYKAVDGVDVSAYQGKINWEAVKDDGISFAMIRCGYRGSTQGTIVQDKYFSRNIIGATGAGLDVGVYFYSLADNTDEAIEEAAYVINAIRDYDVVYPIAFDLEENRPGMTQKKRTDIANAFCHVIEQNGYKAMVYGNRHWLAKYYDMRYLTDYDTWLAQYHTATNYKYAFRMWQYSNKGSVNGINGRVDMNICMLKNY